MTLRTFYNYPAEAPAEVEDPPGPWDSDDPHHVKWGYNLADLDRLARIAVSARRSRSLDVHDAYETAWSAIAETVAADTYPTASDLIGAGSDAIAAESRRHRSNHGLDGRGEAPRFAKYWTTCTTPSPEESVVDRYALWQILPALTDAERRNVYALAAGMEPPSRDRLSRARRRFLALWHEGETPSTFWRSSIPTRTKFTESQVEQMRDMVAEGRTQQEIGTAFGIVQSAVSGLLRRGGRS